MANAPGADLLSPTQSVAAADSDGDKSAQAARQFEAILVRQILSESMKNLTEGSSGQIYGYFVTDSLANAVTKAGGIGLTSILQAQLKQ